MPFKKSEDKRQLELPTLIDVVFLLLIFFLVTFSVSAPGSKTVLPGQQAELPNLPEAEGYDFINQNEVLETLLIQVSHEDIKDATSPKIVYVLWPSVKDSLNVQKAFMKAKTDSSAFRAFPADFLAMNEKEFKNCPPCSLIAAHIDSFKKQHFSEPNPSNHIEMRAEKDIEFRIVNHIMDRCSAYGDTIPRLVFRTQSGSKEKEKEVKSGI
jgi:hypothetical protein